MMEMVWNYIKGTADMYLIAFFGGTARLTAAMRTVMPSSFGTGHQVTKPQSKVIMLDRCDLRFRRCLDGSLLREILPAIGPG